jgi:hypothetical protein
MSAENFNMVRIAFVILLSAALFIALDAAPQSQASSGMSNHPFAH